MAIFQWLRDTTQYLWEGVDRIFAPDRDIYPVTGVQPYDGEPFDEDKSESTR